MATVNNITPKQAQQQQSPGAETAAAPAPARGTSQGKPRAHTPTPPMGRPPPSSSHFVCPLFFSLEAVVIEDEHIAALEVAMDDPLDVEVLEAARDVVQHGRLLLDWQGAAHYVRLVQQVEQAGGRPLLHDAQVGPHRTGPQGPHHKVVLGAMMIMIVMTAARE